MKRCCKCKNEKPNSEFWADSNQPDGKALACRTCKRAANRGWLAKHPNYEKQRYWNDKDGNRERTLKRKYGIGLSDYAVMLMAQVGRCAICKKPEPTHKMFDVDHCHKTGVVRGLLCTNCNRLLGHATDSHHILESAARYLKSSRAQSATPPNDQ